MNNIYKKLRITFFSFIAENLKVYQLLTKIKLIQFENFIQSKMYQNIRMSENNNQIIIKSFKSLRIIKLMNYSMVSETVLRKIFNFR